MGCYKGKSKHSIITRIKRDMCGLLCACFFSFPAHAAVTIPITVNLSETVNVTGTPQIAVNVGGTTRYATYTSGTGTNTLTFTLSPQAGDVDLDGVSVSSPIQLNGGTIKDAKGNNAALTFTPPSTTHVKVNYPSLSLDFTYDADGRYTVNGTAYNDLTSFLTATGGTFSRSGTATYFDSTGVMQTAASNTPRFDYDPVTHATKGILIEEGRTNLLSYSSNFSGASWSNGGVTIVANATTAPDGTHTAQKLIEDTSNARHNIQQAYTATTGNVTTFSVYAKAAESSSFRMIVEGGNQVANYDLVSQTSTGVAGTTTRSITPIGNGWFRCTLTGTALATGGTTVRLHVTTTNGAYTSFVGDGVTGIYFWGAQFENSTFPTSYIPTTSAAVTRGADNLTIPTTGGWFNATAGTFFGQIEEASALNAGGPTRIIGTSALGRFAYRVSGQPSFTIYDGTNIAGATSQPQNSLIKISSSYGPAGLRISSNGTTPGTNTFSGTWGNQGYAWISYLYTGHISKYKYYPAQVPTTQLQLLSQ